MYHDIETNLVSIKIAKGTIDHVIEVGNFLIHVNKNNAPLLLEILDGGKLVGQFKKINEQAIVKQALSAHQKNL